MACGKIDGFIVGGPRPAGIHHAHRRNIHGGAAVDHVAHAALAGIAVGQGVTVENMLFGIKQPLQNQCLAIKLRHVAGPIADLLDKLGGHVEGVNMASDGAVDIHQGKGHQGIVRHDAVTAHAVEPVNGGQIGLEPLDLNRGDRPAVEIQNSLMGHAFHRRAQRIAKGRAIHNAAKLIQKTLPVHEETSSQSALTCRSPYSVRPIPTRTRPTMP